MKPKWLWWGVGILTIFAIFFSWMLYRYPVLKIGKQRLLQMYKVYQSKDEESKKDFERFSYDFNQGGTEKVIGGDVGSITVTGIILDNNSESVTFWNLQGTKTYGLNYETEWQYYDICDKGSDPSMPKKQVLPFNPWVKLAKKGYVTLQLQGFSDSGRKVYRGMAFSGYPFKIDEKLKCGL